MKEIWINLELYIKSYEFSIFRDFFRIFKTVFLILFSIFNNKKKLKKLKKGGAGPARMRRGTQGHVAAPRGPAQCLRGAYILYYIIITIYIKRVLQPRLDGEGINPLKCQALYTRHCLLILSVWD